MKVKFGIKYKTGIINKLETAQAKALAATADALKKEVEQAQVVPFNVGTLQDSMAVDDSKAKNGEARLTMSTPYARRLYFHPEYDFRTSNNANAKGHWFEDWLPGGSQEDFAPQAFASLYKKYTGVGK